MQINGGQLTSIFPSKLLEPQDNARKPVTIDVKASVEFESAFNDSYPAKIVLPSQAAITSNDQQQAQFVRFFSLNESPSSLMSINKETTSQPNFAKLPNGVQQYLQVAATSLVFQQILLDETV